MIIGSKESVQKGEIDIDIDMIFYNSFFLL
jgi:hypothetical protein